VRALRFNAIIPKAELQTSLRLFDCSVCISLTACAGAWFQLAIGSSCFARVSWTDPLCAFYLLLYFFVVKKD